MSSSQAQGAHALPPTPLPRGEGLNSTTSAPAPQPPADIDLAGALARIGGDRRLYGRICRQFIGDQGGTVMAIRSALSRADRAEAIRFAHTLKGLAATLGAGALSRCAAHVEGVLREAPGQPPDPLLDTLQGELAEAIARLQPLAGTRDAEAAPRTAPPWDAEQARSALERLEVLIADNYLEAIDGFASFREQFAAGMEERVDSLAEAMERLDFRRALEECRELKRRLAAAAP